VKPRYSTAEIMALTGLSRFQVYRLKKRCGCGRWLYLSKLRDHLPDMYYSLAMALAGRISNSGDPEDDTNDDVRNVAKRASNEGE
jgi:hypothetical protein